MDCQTLTKFAFLVFVVIMTIYIVFFNKYTSKETFEEQTATAPTSKSMSFTGNAVSTEPLAKLITKGFQGEARNNIPEVEKLPVETEFKCPSECLFKQYTNTEKPTYSKSKLFNKSDSNDSVPRENIPDAIPTLRQQIIDVYYELFKENPSEEVIDFYTKFFRKRQDNLDNMKETISTSAPSLKKTLTTGKSSYLAPETDEGTEDEVIAIYEQILQRHPNNQELAHFAIYVKEDPLVNMEKLKVLLTQSEEYKRLKSMQSNVPYGHLLGGVTDRQITLMVTSIYDDITKNGDKLDEDTFKFLKKKYLEFQMNEQTFRKFVEDFVLFKPLNSTFNKSMKPKSTEVSSGDNFAYFNSPTHLIRAITSTPKEAFQTDNTTAALQQLTSKVSQTFQSSLNDVAPVARGSTRPSKQQTSNNSKTQPTPSSAFTGDNAPGSCLNSDALMDRIKNAECSFDKNYLENRYKSNSETRLSDTVHSRNREELKNICQRNKNYEQYHCEDMVLLPGQEWTVPQRHPPVCLGNLSNYNPRIEQTALIGTLLEDLNMGTNARSGIQTSGAAYQCTQHHNVLKT